MSRLSRIAGWFALVWTVAVTAYLLFGPVYTGRKSAIGRSEFWHETHATLLEVNGPRVLLILAFPLALVALPLFATKPRARMILSGVGATIVGSGALIAGFSIGYFYLPTAFALAIAAVSIADAQPSATLGKL